MIDNTFIKCGFRLEMDLLSPALCTCVTASLNTRVRVGGKETDIAKDRWLEKMLYDQTYGELDTFN